MSDFSPEELERVIARLENPVPCGPIGALKPSFWACGNCRTVHASEQNARVCGYCRPQVCERCRKTIPHNSYCKPCSDAKWAELEDLALSKATIYEESAWGGPVFYEDEVYETVDDLKAYLLDNREPDEWPGYVWVGEETRCRLDADAIIRGAWEECNAPDEWDLRDAISSAQAEAVTAMVAKFNELSSAHWYMESRKQAVRLAPCEDPRD